MWILLFIAVSMLVVNDSTQSNVIHDALDALYDKICEVMIEGNKRERCKQDIHHARDTFHSVLVNPNNQKQLGKSEGNDTGLTGDKVDLQKTVQLFYDFCLNQAENDVVVRGMCYKLSEQGFNIFKQIFYDESILKSIEDINANITKNETHDEAIKKITDIGQDLCSKVNETSKAQQCKQSLSNLGQVIEQVILSPEFQEAVKQIEGEPTRPKRQTSAVVAVPVAMMWLALVASGIIWWG